MHESGTEHRNNVFAVDAELERVERRLRGLRFMDTPLVVAAALLGAVSSSIAAITPAAEAKLSSVGGWKVVCICVAAVGYCAVLASVLRQSLSIGEKVKEAWQCHGELKALSIMSEHMEPKNAAEQLAQIHKKFPRALG